MSLSTCILLVVLLSPLASAVDQKRHEKMDSMGVLPSVISRIHYSLIANNNLGDDLMKIVVDPLPPSHPPQMRREGPLLRRNPTVVYAEDEDDEKDDEKDKEISSTTITASSPTETKKNASASAEPTGSSSSTSSPSGTETSKPTKTESPTKKTESPTPTDPDDNTPHPSPFDSNLGSNFTNPACESFFQSFLSNSTFQNCLPVSLLIQSSLSFFEASRSVVRLARTLDAACAVPRDSCDALMKDLASKLISKAVCGEDLQFQQPVVIQAHNGFRSYRTIHDATCLKNPDTDNYCFSDAITNTSNPANAYVYYLPLGMPLPGSSRPSCNKCLQATMQSFSIAATSDNQPISKTYLPAAQQINIGCGPSFVVAAVKLGSANGASGVTARRMKGSSLFEIMGYVLLFCVGMPFFGSNL
ncbi:hypothetical protein ACJ72_06909 [Emergomyces africanus]|uniref:DUF7729 domain-containing protein n=1 Tax=Emergomyces africanus TaxID=1955775 RepID=A0A1B7NPM9_9EURO|nr:hypothetical protein ACJ72_06909 [Emergomyces africanus]